MGNLILHATGDPVLTTLDVSRLIRDVVRSGIGRVSGDLLVTGPFTYGTFYTTERATKALISALNRAGVKISGTTNGASIRGTGEALRRHDSRVQIVAVEPAESAVLSGGTTGAHGIDGMGAGFVVPLWHKDVADRIEPVSTADATAMSVRLAREEGLFGGLSTGANVVAALRVAEQLGRGEQFGEIGAFGWRELAGDDELSGGQSGREAGNHGAQY